MRLIEQIFVKSSQKYLNLTLKSTQLILSICDQLSLNIQSFHISCWIFHCNITIKSFHNLDRYLVICASIILGMKIGECLKRIEDIILVWRKHIRKSNQKELETDSQQTLKKLKHKALQMEIHLMMTFSFDLDIKLGVEYLKQIEKDLDTQFYKQSRRAITDFYKTELVLYYPPHLIALAALKIASKHMGSKINIGDVVWYKVFSDQTTEEEIDSLVSLIYDYLDIQAN